MTRPHKPRLSRLADEREDRRESKMAIRTQRQLANDMTSITSMLGSFNMAEPSTAPTGPVAPTTSTQSVQQSRPLVQDRSLPENAPRSEPKSAGRGNRGDCYRPLRESRSRDRQFPHRSRRESLDRQVSYRPRRESRSPDRQLRGDHTRTRGYELEYRAGERDNQEVPQQVSPQNFTQQQAQRVRQLTAGLFVDHAGVLRRDRPLTRAQTRKQRGNAEILSQPTSGPAATIHDRNVKLRNMCPNDGFDWPAKKIVDCKGKGMVRPKTDMFNADGFLDCMRKEYRLKGVPGDKASMDVLADIMTGISVNESTDAGPSTEGQPWYQGQHAPRLTREAAELLQVSLFDAGTNALVTLSQPECDKLFQDDPKLFWKYVQEHPSSSGRWFSRGYLLRRNGRDAVTADNLYAYAVLATDARQHYLQRASSAQLLAPSKPLAKAVDRFLAVVRPKMKDSDSLFGVYSRPHKDATRMKAREWAEHCRLCKDTRQAWAKHSKEGYVPLDDVVADMMGTFERMKDEKELPVNQPEPAQKMEVEEEQRLIKLEPGEKCHLTNLEPDVKMEVEEEQRLIKPEPDQKPVAKEEWRLIKLEPGVKWHFTNLEAHVKMEEEEEL